MDLPVPAALRSQNPQLQRIQRVSCVAACDVRQKIQRFLIRLRIIGSHALFHIGQRTDQKLFDFLLKACS